MVVPVTSQTITADSRWSISAGGLLLLPLSCRVASHFEKPSALIMFVSLSSLKGKHMLSPCSHLQNEKHTGSNPATDREKKTANNMRHGSFSLLCGESQPSFCSANLSVSAPPTDTCFYFAWRTGCVTYPAQAKWHMPDREGWQGRREERGEGRGGAGRDGKTVRVFSLTRTAGIGCYPDGDGSVWCTKKPRSGVVNISLALRWQTG